MMASSWGGVSRGVAKGPNQSGSGPVAATTAEPGHPVASAANRLT